MSLDPRTREQALAWLRSGHLRPAQPMGASAEAKVLAAKVHRCFQMFPEVEQLLYGLTIFRPPVNHALEGEAYYRHAQLRAGQDTVAAAFLQYLELAQQPEGETDERSPEPSAFWRSLAGAADEPADPAGPPVAI